MTRSDFYLEEIPFGYSVKNAFEEETVVQNMTSYQEAFAEVHAKVDERLVVEMNMNRFE